MGAAAINALIAPWFARLRPRALSWAYNGASIGGFLFSPLWVFLITRVGFFGAVLVVGAVAIITVCCLSAFIFNHSPETTGQRIDGGPGGVVASASMISNAPLPGTALWRDWKFRTLALGMSLGLFAQIGALSQLFSVSAPALGAATAGTVLGLANLLSAGARAAIGSLLPANADRRIVAMLSYGVQVLGGVALIRSNGQAPALIIAGTLLFGVGIGNATSLPPLIAQVEFSQQDILRVVALVVAMSQATYAFAPAAFGIFRNLAHDGQAFPASEMAAVGIVAAGLQFLAICVFFLGRAARQTPDRFAEGKPPPLANQFEGESMLELRPNCECCDRDLPPSSKEAVICTFECTFCTTCADEVLGGICPNCGGNLVARPIRPPEMLRKAPASTKRVLKQGGCVTAA
jgi:hypothetical protein